MGKTLTLVKQLPPESRLGRAVTGGSSLVARMSDEAAMTALVADLVQQLTWLVQSALSESPPSKPRSIFDLIEAESEAPGEPDPTEGLLKLMAIANGG